MTYLGPCPMLDLIVVGLVKCSSAKKKKKVINKYVDNSLIPCYVMTQRMGYLLLREHYFIYCVDSQIYPF